MKRGPGAGAQSMQLLCTLKPPSLQCVIILIYNTSIVGSKILEMAKGIQLQSTIRLLWSFLTFTSPIVYFLKLCSLLCCIGSVHHIWYLGVFRSFPTR